MPAPSDSARPSMVAAKPPCGPNGPWSQRGGHTLIAGNNFRHFKLISINDNQPERDNIFPIMPFPKVGTVGTVGTKPAFMRVSAVPTPDAGLGPVGTIEEGKSAAARVDLVPTSLARTGAAWGVVGTKAFPERSASDWRSLCPPNLRLTDICFGRTVNRRAAVGRHAAMRIIAYRPDLPMATRIRKIQKFSASRSLRPLNAG